ncbi:hypothetical protein ASPFODRAFT_45408 [Aspergillus luchuensis CBS 106.47]|uniref:Uncharacterized protein n=1 Tax=Aspergillus luchuensis (strain CBS 106.47) TaxID=1137211 RepID=A0A1M3TLP0_ASPLC|nr:hypothetical protein ASPFODRAFT_45408 [Aspergillus luchuensis CBS 106.47]
MTHYTAQLIPTTTNSQQLFLEKTTPRKTTTHPTGSPQRLTSIQSRHNLPTDLYATLPVASPIQPYQTHPIPKNYPGGYMQSVKVVDLMKWLFGKRG